MFIRLVGSVGGSILLTGSGFGSGGLRMLMEWACGLGVIRRWTWNWFWIGFIKGPVCCSNLHKDHFCNFNKTKGLKVSFSQSTIKDHCGKVIIPKNHFCNFLIFKISQGPILPFLDSQGPNL